MVIMTLAFSLLAATAVAEFSLWLPILWRVRLVVIFLIVPVLSVSSTLLLFEHFTIATVLLFFLSAYRLLNVLRIAQNRMHPSYLFHATMRTASFLITYQIFVVGLWWLVSRGYISRDYVLGISTVGILIGASILFISLMRHLRTTLLPSEAKNFSDRELPTLTVAIPARNETKDLEECLQTIIASNYPKLEVLVLDDCSQNKHTPEIIRSFAHEGVRFIAGKPNEDNWLAKNFAYQQLFEAASGEFILFCGVDVRFQPHALRSLVVAALTGNKTMLSVIPRNQLPQLRFSFRALLLQPVRYAWELALPRRLFRRPPPVLSTCWLASRKMLENAGGFAAVSRTITPESYFARVSSVQDGYGFVQTLSDARISSEKTLAEQQATAIRTRYPQLHRRPEQVALVTLLEVLLLLAPFIILIDGIIHDRLLITICSSISCVIVLVTFLIVTLLTYRKILPMSLLAFPVAVCTDIALLNYSMIKYEFSEVIWKGRNVCIPVMRVIPTLPQVNKK